MSFPPVEQQLEVIRRGVEKIVPEQELAAKLQRSRETGVPLRIKYGIDPTGIDLHLGHTVPMRKMRQFQELGHQAVIIIGNYTALVGDPSGRDQTRARLTVEKVEANAVKYLEQLGKVIDLSQAEVHRNGDWFSKMTFADILEMCSKVTVAQLLTREDFSKRMAAQTAISLHECLYPVMQAWDSVVIKSDIELGGTEQLYSFMLARDLQREQKLPEQIGVMSPILVGLDGVRRMGKSLGNYIGIGESPYEMMKKFMQLPDNCLRMFFELLTEVTLAEMEQILAGHPKLAKQKLATTIIGEYYSPAEAQAAVEQWEREISQKAMPDELEELTVNLTEPISLVNLISKELKLTATNSDARRMITQGGVWINDRDNRVTDPLQPITVSHGMVIGCGKKKIVKLITAK
ncbi:MAG: tyrosine--tRNA ligase [Planctomycetaceae bacterium]